MNYIRISHKKTVGFIKRNEIIVVYKKRKKYYENLNVKNITDNKVFWKTVKPFLSEKGNPSSKITLVEGEAIISEDNDVAQYLNKFFSDTVKLLDIPLNSYITNPTDKFLTDPIEIAIQKFDSHPSVLKIRERVQNSCFKFHPTDLKEVEKEISNLNRNKSDTFNSIPITTLKENIDNTGKILHNIFCNMITSCEFPDDLKLADIHPFYKFFIKARMPLIRKIISQ